MELYWFPYSFHNKLTSFASISASMFTFCLGRCQNRYFLFIKSYELLKRVLITNFHLKCNWCIMIRRIQHILIINYLHPCIHLENSIKSDAIYVMQDLTIEWLTRTSILLFMNKYYFIYYIYLILCRLYMHNKVANMQGDVSCSNEKWGPSRATSLHVG